MDDIFKTVTLDDLGPEEVIPNGLILDAKGKPLSSAALANAITFLGQDDRWLGVIAYDEFRDKMTVLKPPPWERGNNDFSPRAWSNVDDIKAAEWLQRNRVYIGPGTTAEAANAVARENRFHPVRDYLTSLSWDGTERLEKILPTYFGTEDNLLVRTMGRCFFVSAVARVMKPGCKVDHALVLEGEQGKRKSTAIEVLFNRFFTGAPIKDFASKETLHTLRGVWGYEIQEIDKIGKHDMGDIKNFITTTVDRYRTPWGRRPEDYPRECVFVGTTNKEDYLRDETGNRRFWPVKITTIDIEALQKDRDQLWAEALSLYRKGVKWWITDSALVREMESAQEDRMVEDPWESLVAEFANGKTAVRTADFLHHTLGQQANITPLHGQRVGAILTRMGFKRSTIRIEGVPCKVFVREDPYPAPPHIVKPAL